MTASSLLTGRVVVTGHSDDGLATIVADAIEQTDEIAKGGVAATFFWGRDDIAAFPDDGRRPDLASAVPPPGGCRFATLEIPPGSNGSYHEFIVKALGELADDAEPGFHRTPTLDFIIVLAGSLELELDSEKAVLNVGDTAVLNGVRHRWSNAGGGTATLLAAQVGARVI